MHMAKEAVSISQKKEEPSLDTRLLSDVIIELNISRHQVAIYPEGHPIVEASLNRVFDSLRQLFDLRPDITIKVAKDLLVIDDSCLDKKNPLFREFALSLSAINVAVVTFTRGMTREELYAFHQFMAIDGGDLAPEKIEEKFTILNLTHVRVGFIDYGAFSFKEGKEGRDSGQGHLWEQYVRNLIEGRLKTEEQFKVIREIPPEIFSQLVNDTAAENLKEETYDRVIAAYLRKSSGQGFAGRDLKKLVTFINRLRPALKKQFLSSSFKTFPGDMHSAEKILEEIPADEAIELLNAINQQKVEIPEAIKNLLQKLSLLSPEGFEGRMSEGTLIVDDIPLSQSIATMLSEDSFTTFVTDDYSREIQALLAYDASGMRGQAGASFEAAGSDEIIEKEFNQILLELISSDKENMITEESFAFFNNLLKDQIEHFIGTGQYGQVLRIFNTLKSTAAKGRFSQTDAGAFPPELIPSLVDSFRIVGSQNSEDAKRLCEYCADEIASPLISALIKEPLRKIRKFLLALIIHLGSTVVPEVIQHLKDQRWFVTRNMLYILSECGTREALPLVKPYCYHDNPRISFQAIRCLLKAEEPYGIEVVKNCLHSGNRERMEMALFISGAFKIKEIVPDIVTMLKQMAKRGSDYDRKIPLVKALGQIGDSRALDILKTILKYNSFLFKGPLQRLKEEICSTLKNYPPEDVKEIIATEGNPKKRPA